MKFYNNTIRITNEYVSASNPNWNMLLDNTNNTSSLLIMTIQLTNNNIQDSKIYFRRSSTNNSTKSYFVSDITVKKGTTILDHIIVIPNGQTYEIASTNSNVIISCSYAQ